VLLLLLPLLLLLLLPSCGDRVETRDGCALVVGSVAVPLPLPLLVPEVETGLPAAVTVPPIVVDAGMGSIVEVTDKDCGGGGDVSGTSREGVHIDHCSPNAWQL